MAIDKLPNTPNVGTDVPKSLWDWLVKVGDKINQLVNYSNTPDGPIPVPAHAATHKTGGSDPLSAADIGAATAADVAASAVPVSTVLPMARKIPPTGWLKVNGQTIGNALSGATARANSDTQALFEILWNDYDNTALPIQDSSGGATTRGANANADFVANKRLPLLQLLGEHLRVWVDDRTGHPDSGRVAGSYQSDQFQGHTFVPLDVTYYVGRNLAVSTGGVNTGTGNWKVNAAGISTTPLTDGVNGNPRYGLETRPRNVALPHYIKY